MTDDALAEAEQEQPETLVPEQSDQSQEWEAMARAWLRAFPEARQVSSVEIEGWIDSNNSSLPSELKSMERSELIDRLFSIQNILRLPTQPQPQPQPQCHEKDAGDMLNPPYQFQRTDLWKPVYTWLESLSTDEVVKSNEISDWLTNNPDIKEQLSAKHSKYHLMHYIKKCHMKILKRKEKKKIFGQSLRTPASTSQSMISQQPVPTSSNSLSNMPKDSSVYLTKRNEALRKYEILVALEKQLLTLFPDFKDTRK